MTHWLISFPCWGKAYRERAQAGPLPALYAALAYANIPAEQVVIIINTDDVAAWNDWVAKSPYRIEFFSVPSDISPDELYYIFGCCHRHAIDYANPDDRVVFLCADMTISVDAFVAADRIFTSGKRLILAPASPTVGQAPIAPARDLLSWSIANLAPIASDLYWREGRGLFAWCVYFRHARGIDFRGFHLHPFACVKHPFLTFTGCTVDFNLSDAFPTNDVYVVTTPNELAVVARADNKHQRRGFRLGYTTVVSWACMLKGFATPRHVWHFSHQITLQGEPDPENYKIANQIIGSILAKWQRQDRRKQRKAVRKLYAHAFVSKQLRKLEYA